MVDSARSPFSDMGPSSSSAFLSASSSSSTDGRRLTHAQDGGMSGWGKILGQMGIPAAALFSYVQPLWEPVGGALTVIGLLTRFWTAGFAVIMLVAIFRSKIPRGIAFWPRQPGQGAGWEFDFLILGVSLALVLLGSGALGLDRMLALPI